MLPLKPSSNLTPLSRNAGEGYGGEGRGEGWAEGLRKALLNLLYPPVCFTCEKLLDDGGQKVCSECWQSFKVLEPTHQIWNEIGGKFWEYGVIESFTSCFLFEDEGPLHEVIHQLKYRGIKDFGPRLGLDLAKRISAHPALRTADYLLPIPLHSVKLRERGYNQADLICTGVSDAAKIPIAGKLMKRNLFTATQTKLALHRRKENVAGAFALNPVEAHIVPGKSFILIDDVITTGSTMNECAAILKLHGAANVYAASVALAR